MAEVKSSLKLDVTIPGTPCAQGRPRTVIRGRFPVIYEDKKSREAKAMARDAMIRYLEAAGLSPPVFEDGPVRVCLMGVWPLPKSSFRKLEPVERAHRTKKPDVDNVAKLYLDALSELAWRDDSQVVELRVVKWDGAQEGDPAAVRIMVDRP